ncbi:MAG: acyltransferase [Proteobacteria bacterium]|nr:acyltransferase [Pseudomonadota bacterium]
MTPKYRPDIDGLRAIAVLCVIFYHSGIGLFSGGYVGVDVFFVISGFLITTIIVREIGEQRFSLANFYQRRMRRILPAIITVVVFCLVVGIVLFETSDYEDLARSSIANNLFLSNVYFNWQAGYFDAAAELKPLLHTWSLSVEEQYYLLFPLLLLLIARFGGKRYLGVLIPILLLSFAACVVGMDVDRTAVFYLLPTRAWELLIGSFLAIAVIRPLQNTVMRNVVAGLGLFLVMYSNIAFDDQTSFPGASAAVPTIGAALIIYTGGSGATVVSRLLSIRPIVFVGLISYSLYLWHWPLLVFAKYYKAVDLTQQEKLFLFAVIFLVSVLSWRFVETPFREKRLLATRRSIFLASFAVTAVLIAVGLSVLVTGGNPGRHKLEQFANVVGGDTEWERWKACKEIMEEPDIDKSLCIIGKSGGEPSFILWGDSHAQSLASAVNLSAARNGVTGVIATRNRCPPLQEIVRPGRLDCHEFNSTILDYISQHGEIDTVILAARWTLSVKGTRYKNEDGSLVELLDIRDSLSTRSSGRELLDAGLRRTIRSLKDLGQRVVVVGPIPEIGYRVPSANHIALITGRDVNAMIAPRLDEYLDRNEEVLEIITQIQKDAAIEVVRPASILCNESFCRVALENGVALYRDDHHLSTFGSKHVSIIFDPLFSVAN